MPLRRRHIETPDPWIIQIRDVNLVVPVPPKGDQRVAANDSWNLGDPEGVKIVLSCLVYFPGLKSRDQAMNIWSLWSSTWNIDEYWFLNPVNRGNPTTNPKNNKRTISVFAST